MKGAKAGSWNGMELKQGMMKERHLYFYCVMSFRSSLCHSVSSFGRLPRPRMSFRTLLCHFEPQGEILKKASWQGKDLSGLPAVRDDSWFIVAIRDDR